MNYHNNYVYLLIEREFIKSGENIYKIGLTKQKELIRFSQYPKGSDLLLHSMCNNCRDTEKEIIKQFKEHFFQRKDYGTEYFEGDCKHMAYLIHTIISNEYNNCYSSKFINIKKNRNLCLDKSVVDDNKNVDDKSVVDDNKSVVDDNKSVVDDKSIVDDNKSVDDKSVVDDKMIVDDKSVNDKSVNDKSVNDKSVNDKSVNDKSINDKSIVDDKSENNITSNEANFEEYSCMSCNYKTCRKDNYYRHLQSVRHLDKIATKENIHICYLCKYKCSKKSNYNFHLTSNKHIQNEKINQTNNKNMLNVDVFKNEIISTLMTQFSNLEENSKSVLAYKDKVK